MLWQRFALFFLNVLGYLIVDYVLDEWMSCLVSKMCISVSQKAQDKRPQMPRFVHNSKDIQFREKKLEQYSYLTSCRQRFYCSFHRK